MTVHTHSLSRCAHADHWPTCRRLLLVRSGGFQSIDGLGRPSPPPLQAEGPQCPLTSVGGLSAMLRPLGSGMVQ